MIFSEFQTYNTSGSSDMIDITDDVRTALEKHSAENGTVTVFVPGSTGAVTTIEFESGALSDLRRLLDELAPENREYSHNLRWGDGNGHSHLRSALLGPSISVPVVNGSLTLGTWQQIILIDCDNKPRQRKVVIQFTGE